MTRQEVRNVVRSLALVEPKALSVELLPEDRSAIREQFVEAFASAFALPLEEMFVMLDSSRMTA